MEAIETNRDSTMAALEQERRFGDRHMDHEGRIRALETEVKAIKEQMNHLVTKDELRLAVAELKNSLNESRTVTTRFIVTTVLSTFAALAAIASAMVGLIMLFK